MPAIRRPDRPQDGLHHGSPAIEVPDSVAAVGWIQKTQYNERFYVIDVQRGNLVVRTTGYSTGGFSEVEFRDLVEQQADLLAELEAPAS